MGGTWSARGIVGGLVSGTLAIAAVVSVGHLLIIGASEEDAEALESPLVMSVVHQGEIGPWSLYGPYGGANPLVLIHAPLYYHLAGGLARVVRLGGLGPIAAALVAGRAISALGLVGTLLAAASLARLGGGSRRAAVWAVGLIVACPILGGMPVAVRPDLLGVMFQTVGMALVLRMIDSGRLGLPETLGAFAAFGLAASIKQSFLASAAASVALLVAIRGRAGLRAAARGLGLAAAIVLIVYGVEEWGTEGRMSRSAFVAASRVREVHPGGLIGALSIFIEGTDRGGGLLLLVVAGGFASAGAGPGRWPRALGAVGTCLFVPTVGLAAWQVVSPIEDARLPLLIAEWIVLPLVLLGCALSRPRAVAGGRVDAALWAIGLGEVALTGYLCYGTSGAWLNYLIELVVLGGVIAGRSLARATAAAVPAWRLLPIALAAPLVLLNLVADVAWTQADRSRDRAGLAAILADAPPASSIFFVEMPGANRRLGRPDLVYDYWLYPVFEKLKLAPNETTWLIPSLAAPAIKAVVFRPNLPQVAHVRRVLEQLGFRPRKTKGRFALWDRAPADAPARRP